MPLLPNRFTGLIPRVVDRMFLSSISVGATGIYSVGYRLGESLSFISGGFFGPICPRFMGAWPKDSRDMPRLPELLAKLFSWFRF